jgi:hypothetical protein
MNNKQEEELVPSTLYQEASNRFREAWLQFVNNEALVKFEAVNMVKILEKDGYSRKDAVKKVITDHSDLKGFSRATIYRQLPDDMKRKWIMRNEKPTKVSIETYEPSSSLEELRRKKGELIISEPKEEEAEDLERQFEFKEGGEEEYEEEEQDRLAMLGLKEENEQELNNITVDENNPEQIQYLIQKYRTKVSNAKFWISHYEGEVRLLEKEIARLENKLVRK